MQEKRWAIGLWKFSEKIPKENLVALTEQWAAEDQNYLQLYIRQASKDQNSIGFIYQLSENGDLQQLYHEYRDRTMDYLKRNFGNDLSGWDISCPAISIK